MTDADDTGAVDPAIAPPSSVRALPAPLPVPPAARIDGLIARLHGLHPRLIDLSLDRLIALLAKLGAPEQHLPPVIHVAGTNGKGSTCAFLRAMAEAAGLRVHVYTSPHLVRFNERFRLAGSLVSDAVLAETLEEVEQVNAGAPITVFEVITAVAFVLFARTPADLCVLEVGLGGRGDATNVIAHPAATAITSISLDHREFLGETLAAIAAEKAGIMKPGVPVVIGAQPEEAQRVLLDHAADRGAPVLLRGRDWEVAAGRYHDAAGTIDLPAPGHWARISGTTRDRHRRPACCNPDVLQRLAATVGAAGLGVPDRAIAAGVGRAEWPARLQRLTGHLAALLPPGWELWLDGGHNPGAGAVLAVQLASWSDRPVHLVVGMKQAKDTAEFLRPLLVHAASVWAVAEPEQHLALPVAEIVAASGGVARPGPLVADALRRLPQKTPRGDHRRAC